MSEQQIEVRQQTVMDDESRHVARVYAEALYQAAEKEGTVQPVLEELDSLTQGVFGKDPGLEVALSSAAMGRDRKKEVLRRAFEGKTTKTFYQFLDVLNNHDRLGLLRGIAAAYHSLHDRKTRRLVIHVQSAVPLIDEERKRLADDVRAVVGFEPVFQETVDPDILGGLIIRVHDWVYDASVRNRLQSVRNQLIERSSHGIQSGRDRFGS